MGYAVFVGDVALDEYYRADYWPTIKDKAIVHALPAVPGGMIANAACVAAALP
jgi:ribokinase